MADGSKSRSGLASKPGITGQKEPKQSTTGKPPRGADPVAVAVATAPPYFIVEADTVRELADAVNDNIDRHTQPQGGPFKFFNDVYDKPRWGQAMFRQLSIH